MRITRRPGRPEEARHQKVDLCRQGGASLFRQPNLSLALTAATSEPLPAEPEPLADHLNFGGSVERESAKSFPRAQL